MVDVPIESTNSFQSTLYLSTTSIHYIFCTNLVASSCCLYVYNKNININVQPP